MCACRDAAQKALFAAIAQDFGREGLRFMTASVRLVHEGCGSGHFTVDGADNNLRNALAIAWHWAAGDNLGSYLWHHEPVRA